VEGDPAQRPSADEAAKSKASAYVGRVLGGRYKVDSVLALGGMGAVFRAWHVHMRKFVALKLLHPTTENLPELALRFERESIVNANLTHPNVCSAMDFGQFEDGAHYLVLEYIEGRTLRDLMKEGPVEPARAVEITRQIAEALAAAHELGIVHRDVKPSNIMVADGPRVHVKMVDFGLAKIPSKLFQGQGDDVRVTRSGTVFGTVAYMAPELAGGMHLVDHRSDLYALGVVFYEMLAGKHPFDAIEPTELFRQHRGKAVPPIAERAPGVVVPPEIEAIVRRMLAKNPDERYQDADELLGDLDHASPPEALPPSRPSSTRTPISWRPGNLIRPRKSADSGPESGLRARPLEGPDAADASPPPTPVSKMPPDEGRTRRIAIVVLAIASLMLVGIGGIRIYAPATWERFGLEPSRAAPAASSAPVAASAAPVESAAPSESAEATADAPKPPAPLTPEAIQLRGVLHEAAAEHDAKRGARALIDLARVGPDAFRATDVVASAAAIAVGVETGDRSSADEVFELLGGSALGAAGPDVLFHIVCFSGGSRAAARATDLLAKDEVLRRASPALRIARELRSAPCKDRPALYDRALAEGDERALSVMSAMRGQGCLDAPGACCAQSDPKLADAAQKLRERLRK
jgi:eukaryotic-like serine/threonine-protein kinase